MPEKLRLWLLCLCTSTSFASNASADIQPVQTTKLDQYVLASLSKDILEGLLDQKKPYWNLSYNSVQSNEFSQQGKEWHCLTEAIYFEARGESVMGQLAVAEVILNRVDSAGYPETICKVVNQGTGRKHSCQFSYTCDGLSEDIADKKAFEQIGEVASFMISGKSHNITRGATHYHNKSVAPSWSSKFHRTKTIGKHHFYRVHKQLSMK